MVAGAGISASSRFSVKSSSHAGRSCKRFPAANEIKRFGVAE